MAFPGLSTINRFNPARWLREAVSPGSDPREFWLGRTYDPTDFDPTLATGEEQRTGLRDIMAGAQAYDPGFGGTIESLRAQAFGIGPTLGERAVGRAGERALAGLRSQAKTARGFGAQAAQRQAMQQSAELGTQLAGQRAMAGRQDRAAAQQQLTAALAAQDAARRQQQQIQLQALAQMSGIDARELQARLQMQALEQAAAAGDRGAVERILAMGAQLMPAMG